MSFQEWEEWEEWAGAELSVWARCSDGGSGEVPSGGGPGWMVALSPSG